MEAGEENEGQMQQKEMTGVGIIDERVANVDYIVLGSQLLNTDYMITTNFSQ